LNVNTNVWSKLPFCKSKENKLILSNVSGIFKRGMNAILGKYHSFNIQYKNIKINQVPLVAANQHYLIFSLIVKIDAPMKVAFVSIMNLGLLHLLIVT
jgi:hypothetical protein